MPREAKARLNQGEKFGKIYRGLGIVEQSYYRWCRLDGGLKVHQARRLLRELRLEAPGRTA